MQQETQSQTVQTKEGVELLKAPLLTSNGTRRMSNSIGWFPISFDLFLVRKFVFYKRFANSATR